MNRIIKPTDKNPGDRTARKPEERVENLTFNIHKFNDKPKPEPKDILIISSFSEFGCETVGVMYSIPLIKKMFVGKYIIAIGWYGRQYFYQHLVDEYWELKEEHQWLREYSRAFHHESKNIKNLENMCKQYGTVLPSYYLGQPTVGVMCKKCYKFLLPDSDKCPCGSDDLALPLFRNIFEAKKDAVRIPMPSKEKMIKASEYIKDNSVAIFARGRKCYGRNLQPEFYIKLIKLVRNLGFEPIWMGEKATTQPCPVEDVLDFSRMEEARDLETTLAILSQCKFTIQFWTASTRLASMVGTPYILFESPDQIYGMGQEGYRRNLCDFAPGKLVIAHFRNMFEDNDKAIRLVERAVKEICVYNFNDIADSVETRVLADGSREGYASRSMGESKI